MEPAVDCDHFLPEEMEPEALALERQTEVFRRKNSIKKDGTLFSPHSPERRQVLFDLLCPCCWFAIPIILSSATIVVVIHYGCCLDKIMRRALYLL